MASSVGKIARTLLSALLVTLAGSACQKSKPVDVPEETPLTEAAPLPPYENFAALAKENVAGKDYEIRIHDRTATSKILVMAFHGGFIEPGTVELADAVGGEDASTYSFVAKAEDSRRFHITSTQYDEPGLLALLPRTNRCLSLHGFKGNETDFCIGGGDAAGRRNYLEKLRREFPEWRACETCCPPNNGVSAKNVVNRCSFPLAGKKAQEIPGVQLEMSPPLRDKIVSDPIFRRKLASFLRARLKE